MENSIKVCTIDGISYPLLGDGFFDRSLPHMPCGICKYAICAHCGDLFSFKHECKWKWQYVRRGCICSVCDERKNNKELLKFENKNI